MDWYQIIAMAIIGGIGGAILGRRGFKKNPDQKKNRFAMVVFALVVGGGGVLVRSPDVKNAIMSAIDPNYEVKTRILRKMSSLTELPGVKEKLQTFDDPAKANAYSSNLVRQGLKRLTFSDLKEWNQLRIDMAEVSPELCSGFWTGRLTQDYLFTALASLEKEKVDRWVEVSLKAAKLELAGAEYPQVQQNDFQESLALIGSLYPEKERLKMSKVLVKGPKATDQEACWMISRMLKGAQKLQDKPYEKFLRFMASL